MQNLQDPKISQDMDSIFSYEIEKVQLLWMSLAYDFVQQSAPAEATDQHLTIIKHT